MSSDITELFFSTCDSLVLGNDTLFLQNNFGCDSLIITTVSLLPTDSCEVEVSITVDNINCNELEGTISLQVTNGQPPFEYFWEGDGPNILFGDGSIPSVNTSEMIVGMEAGTYNIRVVANNGIESNLEAVISQKYPAEISTSADSEYNGYAISCTENSDGITSVSSIVGGNPPFSYSWSNGQNTKTISNLVSGRYFVTVTDSLSCISIDSIDLFSSPPLEVKIIKSDASCFGKSDGQIRLDSISGGNGPFLFSINANPFQDSPDFLNLAAGIHEIKVQDIFGCEAAETVQIHTPPELLVELGQDTVIQRGMPLLLDPNINLPLDNFQWFSSTLLPCEDCMPLFFYPVENTTIGLSVIDEFGCTGTDEINIIVNVGHKVFIPTAFSPDGDGINDRFRIYGGKDLTKIHLFKIFNRWGSLIFEVKDFQSGDYSGEWDGSFSGKILQSNVFAYFAEIEFEDGRIELYSGEVTLMR
ncbi:MAG: T9SS type B sorting domain-containing protein [Bacteroidetes bacterium]|nr:T9SS type B sorting domain-containing protein [Bacteroidota bacterium]